MAFKKGQSGNPGGRPKALATVQDLARAQTEASMATLVAIRDKADAPDATRVAAATALLDRGWGKPGQSIALGQDPDLDPLAVDVRPQLTREAWLKAHNG